MKINRFCFVLLGVLFLTSACSTPRVRNNAPVSKPQVVLTNVPLVAGSHLVIASAGSNKDEADKVTSIIFTAKAGKGDVKVTEATVTVTGTAAGNLITAYLFDGSTEIDNAAVTGGVAKFTGLEITVAKNSSKQFNVKFDVRRANETAKSFITTVAFGPMASSDSVVGDALFIQNAGPVFTLVGTPVLSKSPSLVSSGVAAYSASFTFDVEAAGDDLRVGAKDFIIGVYANGVLVSTAIATYEKPTSGVTGANAPYIISENNKARFTVRTSFTSSIGHAGEIFSARLESAMGKTWVSGVFRATKDTSGSVVTF